MSNKSKQKNSKPPSAVFPSAVFPGPSQQELDILTSQQQLLAQQLSQASQLFSEGQQDRNKFRGMLSVLEDDEPYRISPDEASMLDKLRDSYYNYSVDKYKNSTEKEIFDKEQRDSIANLHRRGVLDSSVGAQVLGEQEGRRQRILQELGSDAALKRLALEQDTINRNVNTNLALSQLISGQGMQLPEISNTISANASQNAAQVAQQLASERTAKFNVDVQNKQLQYLSALNKPKPIRSAGGFGALGGAGIGALLAGSLTGGMGALAGAQLGGLLGGTTGSLIKY